MKRKAFILLTFFLTASCSKKLNVTKGITSEFKSSYLTYNLPKKEILVKVDFEVTKTKSSLLDHPSYDYVYSDKLKSDLNNKLFSVYSDKTVYKFSKISLIENIVPDPNKVYTIELNHPKWYEVFSKIDYSLSMNNAGILTDSKYTFDNYTADFTADLTTGLVSYILKPTEEASDGYIPPPIDKNVAKEKLDNTISTINKLENRRQKIVCDELPGFDRKNIDKEIKLIDSELAKMYILLKGKKLPSEKKSMLFSYDPSNPMTIYFHEDKAPSTTDANSHKYVITTEPIKRWTKTETANFTSAIGTDTEGFAYNIPALCKIDIKKGDELISSQRTYIPQLGVLGYLETKGLSHFSSEFKLDASTGALLKVATKNSTLADPSKYGSSISEAIKGIEKKDDKSPPKEIDVMISDLEKQFKLLDLQFKIDSLEAKRIDP